MKARVYVSMKPTVLDPQGQTIRSALAGLGHTSIAMVRQGKFFEIKLEPGTERASPLPAGRAIQLIGCGEEASLEGLLPQSNDIEDAVHSWGTAR